ncbi:hypothetical protein MVEN_02312300 [Mycena venus]|uniref:Uncharacterized protein n=1 Tax=Mycena venus TaxID=2733690 RepID=A0A8H6X420_9AGAR|nr:hypothetical protein MVEN_02312300 [Mycena venus]
MQYLLYPPFLAYPHLPCIFTSQSKPRNNSPAAVEFLATMLPPSKTIPYALNNNSTTWQLAPRTKLPSCGPLTFSIQCAREQNWRSFIMRGVGRCMSWMLRHGRARGWRRRRASRARVRSVYFLLPCFNPPRVPGNFFALRVLMICRIIFDSCEPHRPARLNLCRSQTGDFVCATLHDEGPPTPIILSLHAEAASLQSYVVLSQPSLLRTVSRCFKPAKVQLEPKPYAMRYIPCGLAVVSILADNANYRACTSTNGHTVMQQLTFLPSFAPPPPSDLPLQLVSRFKFSLVKSITASYVGLLFFVFPFVFKQAAVLTKLRFTANCGALMRQDGVIEQCKMWDARVMRLVERSSWADNITLMQFYDAEAQAVTR